MTTQRKWILLIGGGSLLLGCLVICFSALYWKANPEGKYDGYQLMQHDSADTLIFDQGTVTHWTCCGQEAWGTYQVKEGRLYWTKVGVESVIIVTPTWFGADLSWNHKGGAERMWVRRKVTRSTIF